MGKIYKAMVCKTPGMSKQRTVTSESQERNEVGLVITPACSQVVARFWYRVEHCDWRGKAEILVKLTW